MNHDETHGDDFLLDQRIRAFYHAEPVPDFEIPTRSDVPDVFSRGPVAPSRNQRWIRFATIAAAACTLILIATWSWFRVDAAHEASWQVAAEVARNHSGGYAPDVTAPTLLELAPKLSALPFKLVTTALDSSPDRLLLDLSAPVGGRYCSIKGQKAAQILLTRSDGQHITHYQVGMDALPDIEPGTYDIPASSTNGAVRVKLWTEDNVLMGTAESLSAPTDHPAHSN